MNDQEITDHIKNKISYSSIIERLPTTEQVILARSVSTNLTALGNDEVDALSLYAEVMTEIQVQLYCPNVLL